MQTIFPVKLELMTSVFISFHTSYRTHSIKSTQYKKLAPNALWFKLKCEILQIVWNKWNKQHQTISFQFFTFSILMFFHEVCKISNSNKWTAKHLAQVSCTELTLSGLNFWIKNDSEKWSSIFILKFMKLLVPIKFNFVPPGLDYLIFFLRFFFP